jgi:hypothetical protein
MFERYTERARRVLFFARDEARRTGGDAIEAGHLLLGLLREASGMSARAFARAHVSPDEVRKALEGRAIVRERRRADGDLQFSDETRRILELAAEEADRLLHNHIGTEHLLLGILRDPESLAGSILAERGMRVDAVSDDIVILTCERLMTPGARQRHPEFPPPGEAKVVPTQRTQHESVADDKGADYWAVEGASLKTMLSKLYGMQTTRIELPASLDDDRRLEAALDRPVVDETNLTGAYELDVRTDAQTSDQFLHALCDRLGLAATPAKRHVAMLVARQT